MEGRVFVTPVLHIPWSVLLLLYPILLVRDLKSSQRHTHGLSSLGDYAVNIGNTCGLML